MTRLLASLTTAALAAAGVVVLSSLAALSVEAAPDRFAELRGAAPITDGADIYLAACDSCHTRAGSPPR